MIFLRLLIWMAYLTRTSSLDLELERLHKRSVVPHQLERNSLESSDLAQPATSKGWMSLVTRRETGYSGESSRGLVTRTKKRTYPRKGPRTGGA